MELSSTPWPGFEAYVAKARPAPLWRTVLGAATAVVLASFLAGLLPRDAPTPWDTLCRLGSVGFLALSLWISMRLFHRRGIGGVLNAQGRLRFRPFAIGLGVGLVAQSLLVAVLPNPVQTGLVFSDWAMLVLPVLALITVQITAEELFFRGYLLQNLGARFNTPWVWAVAPSVIFAAAHGSAAPPGVDPLVIVGTAFLFGLVTADITARHGDLSPALGLHLGYNAVAILGVSASGPFSGLPLATYTADGSTPASYTPLLMVLCYGSYRLALIWQPPRC